MSVCLEQLLAAATPGPWLEFEYVDGSLYIETVGEDGQGDEYVLELRPNSGTKDADMGLILLAPDMARLLIDMGEELRAVHNGPGEVNYTPRIPPLLARLDALGKDSA